MVKRIGLIVNPIAGIGGRVGLKGSDGYEIQQQALKLGAVPRAGMRTLQCLKVVEKSQVDVEIVCPPGEMGESNAREAGFNTKMVSESLAGKTTAQDTIDAAKVMLESQVDLLMFAGGDGTARDIYQAIGDQLPVIGIPAGVKIHSAVFATHPYAAGELLSAFLNSKTKHYGVFEVVDIDEDAYRKGIVTTRLYGYLTVPYHQRLLQNRKAPTPAAGDVQMEAIARDVIENMQEELLYILGPGTTTRAIAEQIGVQKTLVGVDVVRKNGLVAMDVGEEELLALTTDQEARIIITPIGGQGFLFGRGNQPISPRVIEMVGMENIMVISTPEKLNSLAGTALLVDTGDRNLDKQLVGYIPVTTGYHDKVIFRVAA